MNCPTTLYPFLFAALPAIVAPVQAYPYAAQPALTAPLTAETAAPTAGADIIVESHESDREAAMHLISQLRPIAPGKIFWKEKDYDSDSATAQHTNLRIYLSVYDTPRPFIQYNKKHHELSINWSPAEHRRRTADFVHVLQHFTQNGTLQLTTPEKWEKPLQHAIVYREMNWQDVLIVSPDKELGNRVANALRPYLSGKLRQSRTRLKRPHAGVVIHINEHEGPTRARLDYHRDSSLHLDLTTSGGPQRIQYAIDGLLSALRPFVQEGKLRNMRDGELYPSLSSAFHKETVEWHNIVVGDIEEEDALPLIEALHPLTNGKIRWRRMQKESLATTKRLGNDYLFIRLISFHNTPSYMCVSEGVLPQITLNYSPSPSRKQPEETQAQYEARWTAAKQEIIDRFIRALQPLLQDGKLPPISVQELQEHLNKY